MATVIDALLVTLNLDATGFKKGQKDTSEALKATREDATKTAKDMQAAGKKASEYYSALEKAASSLLAVVGAGDLASFAVKRVDEMSSISRAASAMNLPVDKLQAYSKWIERMGGDAKTATASLQSLSQLLVSVQIGGGSPEQRWALSSIGAQPNDDPTVVAKKFAEWAHAQPKNRAAMVQRFGNDLGFDEAQIYALKTAGGAGMQRGMSQSLVMTDQQLAQAAKTQEAVRSLFQALVYNADALVADASVAVPALNAITQFLKQFPTLAQGMMALAGALVAFRGAVTVLRLAAGVAGVGVAGGAEAAAGTAAAGAGIAGGVATGGLGLILWGAYDVLTHPLTTEQRIAGLQKQIAGWKAQPGSNHGMLAQDIRDNEALIRKLQGGHSSSATAPAKPSPGFLSSLEKQFGLPPGLLDSVWNQESRRGAHMGPSSAGALGHFQFMPGTASQYGVSNPFDFGQSAHGAAKYFSDLLKHYSGDAGKAIAAYNWGEGHLDRDIKAHGANWMAFLPKETRNYLAQVGGGMGGRTAISIANINVNVAHGDPQKIAQGIGGAIQRNGLVAQANRGLS